MDTHCFTSTVDRLIAAYHRVLNGRCRLVRAEVSVKHQAAKRMPRFVRFPELLLVVVGIVMCLTGCGGSKIKTHPVAGKVAIADGSPEMIAGCIVEFMQVADPLVRSSGRIDASGAFRMETLFQGEILSGVPEGEYKARIIISDEDEDGNPRRGPLSVHKRFQDFESSGWSVVIPGGEASFQASKK